MNCDPCGKNLYPLKPEVTFTSPASIAGTSISRNAVMESLVSFSNTLASPSIIASANSNLKASALETNFSV